MIMTLAQTKLTGLTMELDLKVREYSMLCDNLEELKASNIDPDDVKLLPLKESFQKNYIEILEINKQIKELKKELELERKKSTVKSGEEIFKKKKNKYEEKGLMLIANKETWFKKIIEKVKNMFAKYF